jgi:hypothetical protein
MDRRWLERLQQHGLKFDSRNSNRRILDHPTFAHALEDDGIQLDTSCQYTTGPLFIFAFAASVFTIHI